MHREVSPPRNRDNAISTFSVSTTNSVLNASPVDTGFSSAGQKLSNKFRRTRTDSERGGNNAVGRPAFLDHAPPGESKPPTSFFGRLRSKSRTRAADAKETPGLVEKRVEDFEEKSSGALTDGGESERHSRSSSRTRVLRKKSARGGEDTHDEPVPVLPAMFSVAPQLEPLMPNDRQSKGLLGSFTEQFGAVMNAETVSPGNSAPPSSFKSAILLAPAASRRTSVIRTTGSGPRAAAAAQPYRSVLDRPKPQTRSSGFFANHGGRTPGSASARVITTNNNATRIRMKTSDRVAMLRADVAASAGGGGAGGSSVTRKGSLGRNSSLNRKNGGVVKRGPSLRDGRGAKARLASAAAQASKQAEMRAEEEQAAVGALFLSSGRASLDEDVAESTEGSVEQAALQMGPDVIEEEVEDTGKAELEEKEEPDASTKPVPVPEPEPEPKATVQHTPAVSPSKPVPAGVTPSPRSSTGAPSRPLPSAPAPAPAPATTPAPTAPVATPIPTPFTNSRSASSVSALINQIQSQIQAQAQTHKTSPSQTPAPSFSRFPQPSPSQSSPSLDLKPTLPLSPQPLVRPSAGLTLNIPASSRSGTDRPGTPGSHGRRQVIPRSPLKPPTSPLPPTPVSSASTITATPQTFLQPRSTSQYSATDSLTPPSTATLPSTGLAPPSPTSPGRSDWFDDSPSPQQTQFANTPINPSPPSPQPQPQPQPQSSVTTVQEPVPPLATRSTSPPSKAFTFPAVKQPAQSLTQPVDSTPVTPVPTVDSTPSTPVPTVEVSVEEAPPLRHTPPRSSSLRKPFKAFVFPAPKIKSTVEAPQTSHDVHEVLPDVVPAVEEPVTEIPTSMGITIRTLDLPDAAIRLSTFTSAEELDAQITLLLSQSPVSPVPPLPRTPPSLPPTVVAPAQMDTRSQLSVAGGGMARSATAPGMLTAEPGLRSAKSFTSLRPTVEVPTTINRSASTSTSSSATARGSPSVESVLQTPDSGGRPKPFAGATPGWSMSSRSAGLKSSRSFVFPNNNQDVEPKNATQEPQAPPSTWAPGRLPAEPRQRQRATTMESRGSQSSRESFGPQPPSTTLFRTPSIASGNSNAPSSIQRVMSPASRPASPAMTRGRQSPFPSLPRKVSGPLRSVAGEQSSKVNRVLEDSENGPGESSSGPSSWAAQLTNGVVLPTRKASSDRSHPPVTLRTLPTQPTLLRPLLPSARNSRASRNSEYNSSDDEDRFDLDSIVDGYDDDSEEEVDRAIPKPGKGLALIAARLGQQTPTGRGDETLPPSRSSTPDQYIQTSPDSIGMATAPNGTPLSASSSAFASPLRRRPTQPPGPPPVTLVTRISPTSSEAMMQRNTSTTRRKALGAGAGGSQWI
ncbi:hypothetical protein FRB95_000422 [Tulasnella sp. JGI-2019a]|nr:hypothetical protein FRB95_000422 [Tulasnella sp. JGI-2019a]